jgi:phage/plasmid-associated DNA primase
MKTTTEYLNDNDINWVGVPVINKKFVYSDTYTNVYLKQILEDNECLKLVEEYVEKKLEEGNKDYNSSKACSAQEFMLSNDTLIKKSQKIFIEEKLYNRGFIIATDTTNVIQLDIDIDTDEDYNNLTNKGRKMYQQLKHDYPYYYSQSKKNGLHIFLIDKEDKLLTTKLKNCFNNKSVISDYNKWKLNEEGPYMNKDYGFIEVMCGKPMWCGEEIQNIKKKIGGSKSISVLNTIFKKSFVDSNKKKTKQEIKNLISKNTIEPPSPVKNNLNKNIDHSNYNEICEYLNNIKKNNFDSYSTFVKIVFCLCKDSQDRYKQVLYDIGSKSSKAKSNYEEWFDKLYRDGKIKSTFKTPYAIITLSKDSNLTKHYEIYNRYNKKLHISQFTPEELACIFYENNEDNFMVVKAEMPGEPPEVYYYNDTDFTWSNEDKNKFRIIKRNIYVDLTEYLKNKKQSLENELEVCNELDSDIIMNKIDIIIEKINKLGSTELRTQICECLVQKINTENQVECRFDSNEYILPFKDCVYDLKQNTVREYYKTDYILTKIPYEYREPCEDNYIELKNFLTSLFPHKLHFIKIETKTQQDKWRNIYRRIKFNDFEVKKSKFYGFEVIVEHRQDYWDVIYVLAMGLFGKTLPYIHIFNGEGCNGKSVICDLMKNILGNNKFYVSMKGNNLCEDFEVNGPSPHWANMDKKRFAAFQEPNENKELCVATLKYITENNIEARHLFSNKTSVSVMAVYVLCCNVRPEVDGASNNALERRIKDIEWPHQYCNTKQEFKQTAQIKYRSNKRVKSIKFKYMGVKNTKFADLDWQDEAKYSLLKYLLGFIKGFEKQYEKPIYDIDWKYSKIVEERSKEYLGSGDRITEFLDTNLLPHGGNKQYIKLSDLYRTFQERSEFYKNAKTSVKDKYSKNKFYHLISQSKKYYSYYRSQKEIRENGTRKNIGPVLINLTIKTEEELREDNKNTCLMSDEEFTDDDMTDSDCDIEIPYENENEITYTSPLEHGMPGTYYSSEESDSE